MEKKNSEVSKNNTKNTTKKKVDNNIYRNRIFLIIIVLVIIVCIVAICILTGDNKKPNDNVGNNNSNNVDNNSQNSVENNDDINAVYENIIDMSKTENVKIENNVKINVSDKIAQEKIYEGMKVKQVKLTSDGNTGVTGFTAIIENTSGKDFAGGSILIKFVNKDGSDFSTLEGTIAAIPAGGSTEIGAYTGVDLANAYDYSIVKK